MTNKFIWFLRLLLLLVWPASVWADITYISGASGRNDALPTNGTYGALTISKPAGVVAGQALIASIAARPQSMAYTAPSGWTLMTTTNQPQGGSSTAPGGMTLLTFYKIVTTTDPTSYTWTFKNASNTGGSAVGGILAFSGIDTTSSPVNVWSAKLTGSSTTHSTNPITTTVDNTMIVSSISYLSASSFNNPTGITGLMERLDQSAPLAATAIGTTLQMSTAPKASMGAAGPASATITGGSGLADYGVGHLMALRPAQVDTFITMTGSGALVAGNSASYTITIGNNGLTPEAGPVTVVDTLPTGLSYASFSGSGWSCGVSGQVVTCLRSGTIAAGASAPSLTINVNVASNASGTVSNTVTVTGGSADSNSVNNTAINTYVFPSVAYAYYPMEETSWGVIQDASGNARNASALGSASATGGALTNPPYAAIPGNPGTCGAGLIPNGATAIGVNTSIDVNSIGKTGTIMFWYSSNQGWNNGVRRMLFDGSGDNGASDKHFYLVKNDLGALVFAMEDSNDTDSTAISPSYNFPANEWHHIAVTWDLSLSQTRIYLDGDTVPIAMSDTALNGNIGNLDTLYLGARQTTNITGATPDYTSNTANGYIDEVRIFQGALTAAEISALADQTHACPAGVAVNPVGFNCVETGLNGISGHLYTKPVGAIFAFDVVALKDADSNGVADGVETTYASQADKTVSVELVDGSGSTSCSTRTAISPAMSLVFTKTGQITDQGRKRTANMTVSQAYPNVRCRVTEPNQTPSCSMDSFAVRPGGFTLTSSANADSAGLNAGATPTVKAGASFTLTAASGAAGYNLTPKIDAGKLNAHSGAIQAGNLAGSFGVADANTGTASGTAFNYSEVGYFNFSAYGVYDDSFTAVDSAVGDCSSDFSNVAVGNLYGCNFGNTSVTDYFGRFIPDHFDATLNTPVFAPACATFTYVGQPIKYAASPVATVTAKNASAITTRNYTGGFWKISPNHAAYGIAPSYGEASQALTVLNTSPPLAVDSGNGVGTLTFANTTSNILAVTRGNPIAPFNAEIALSFNLWDTDAVTVANINAVAGVNPVRFGMASAGNGMAFTGNNKEQRWGRLALQNAYGSELIPLPVSLYSEYFNGSSFVMNTADNCSTLALNSQLALSNPVTAGGASQAGNASMTLAPSGNSQAVLSHSILLAGDAGLSFSAPGSGNIGYIDITGNFASLPWLLFDWDHDGAHNNSPVARASFGIYGGNRQQIYWREVY